MVWGKEKRVDNYPVFGPLYPVYLVCLLLNRHILVDDANAALSGNGDGHAGFCHRIHGGGDQRRI